MAEYGEYILKLNAILCVFEWRETSIKKKCSADTFLCVWKNLQYQYGFINLKHKAFQIWTTLETYNNLFTYFNYVKYVCLSASRSPWEVGAKDNKQVDKPSILDQPWLHPKTLLFDPDLSQTSLMLSGVKLLHFTNTLKTIKVWT